MSKVNALICDSGISISQKGHIKPIDIGLGWKDNNGHGSQIVNVNKSLFNKVSINSIKILDEKKQCGLDTLLSALDIIKETDVDIICLALAIEQEEINPKLLKEIEQRFIQITKQGKIVISALHNKKNNSYPASLNNVIGVRMVLPSTRTAFYTPSKKIQCELQVEPVICYSLDGIYKPFTGNSMASAFFFGHVCNILLDYQKRISFNQLEQILSNQTNADLSFNKIECRYDKNEKEKLINIKNLVAQLVRSYFPDLNDNRIFERIKNIQLLNDFIHSLSRLDLKINNKTFLKFSDLETVDTLSNYLQLQG